jgi:hypothetical protein
LSHAANDWLTFDSPQRVACGWDVVVAPIPSDCKKNLEQWLAIAKNATVSKAKDRQEA